MIVSFILHCACQGMAVILQEALPDTIKKSVREKTVQEKRIGRG